MSRLHVTAATARAFGVKSAPKRAKYGAVRVREDGHTFDSKAEHARYCELKLLRSGRSICELEVHPRFPLSVNGRHITSYEADFSYRVANRETGRRSIFSRLIVEDCKGMVLDTYRLKRELFKALYPDADFRELSTDKSADRKAWTKHIEGKTK